MNGADIIASINKFKIKNFRGIMLMKSRFPKHVHDIECGILNKNFSAKSATTNGHWVCYWKNGDEKYYFDSFGEKPPLKLVKYLGDNVIYNKIRVQNSEQNNCGQLCITVLKMFSDGQSFSQVLDLIND